MTTPQDAALDGLLDAYRAAAYAHSHETLIRGYDAPKRDREIECRAAIHAHFATSAAGKVGAGITSSVIAAAQRDLCSASMGDTGSGQYIAGWKGALAYLAAKAADLDAAAPAQQPQEQQHAANEPVPEDQESAAKAAILETLHPLLDRGTFDAPGWAINVARLVIGHECHPTEVPPAAYVLGVDFANGPDMTVTAEVSADDWNRHFAQQAAVPEVGK